MEWHWKTEVSIPEAGRTKRTHLETIFVETGWWGLQKTSKVCWGLKGLKAATGKCRIHIPSYKQFIGHNTFKGCPKQATLVSSGRLKTTPSGENFRKYKS